MNESMQKSDRWERIIAADRARFFRFPLHIVRYGESFCYFGELLRIFMTIMTAPMTAMMPSQMATGVLKYATSS